MGKGLHPQNCDLSQVLDFSKSTSELESRSVFEIRLASKSLTTVYCEQRIRSSLEEIQLLINLNNTVIMQGPAITSIKKLTSVPAMADIRVVNHGDQSESLWNQENGFCQGIFFLSFKETQLELLKSVFDNT